MNKSEFLEKLIKMFPRSFTEENKQLWINEYKRVLVGNIDYKKMDKAIYSTWLKVEAPKPAQIKEMYLSDALIDLDIDFQRTKQILNEKPVPPPEDIKKKVQELKLKLSMEKQKNDKII